MNEIITQANKDLAKIFGLCWHAFDNGDWVTVAQPCDEEKCVHCEASNLFAPRPDFRKIFSVVCEECAGGGVTGSCMSPDCPGWDKPASDCRGCLPECSVCNGIGCREITMLQIHAERDNTWLEFLWYLVWLSVTGGLSVPGGKDMKYEMRPLLVVTDTNALLVKYRDWRLKHEANKT